MLYNFKRALGISFLLYVATFITGIVCGAASGQDMSSLENISDAFWYVGMVSGVVLTALFAMWYFKNTAIIRSATAGFLFGLTAVTLSFVLDYALFTLGDTGESKIDMGDYYGDYRFWIILVLVIATAKIVGHMKGKSTPKPLSTIPVK
jgi:hypothetical protein